MPKRERDGSENDVEAETEVEDTKPTERRVIVLLDLANLETVKTKNGDFELLNCDDHVQIMKRNKKDPAKYRPDILHQELMAVLDSPLNKSGHVQVYFHTEKNVLVEVNPTCRIPRTFKRFSGLMVQLLHRLKIRSSDGRDTLLKVIKNPMSRHLPPGVRCYGFSQGGTLYNPSAFVRQMPDKGPIMFVLGAMASGSIKMEDHPYMTEKVSISEYPLSGVVAINRVLGALENHWGIV
jgi:rRNA small subunit pseudouridine methyltransferase Nep1